MTISQRLAIEGVPDSRENTAPPLPLRPGKRLVFLENDPLRVCFKCQGDRIEFFYHGGGVAIKSIPPFPCYSWTMFGYSMDVEQPGEHLCKRCSTCTFSWMEEVAEEGPEYQIVAVEESDLYDGTEGEVDEMPFRKTGAVTGSVLGVDEDTALVKEAASQAPWDDRDEKDLDAENTDADKDE